MSTSNIQKLDISIGICAFNESRNILHMIRSLLLQKLNRVFIREIFVISDGSTDSTCELVQEFVRNTRVKIVENRIRQGKWAAINQFLKKAHSPVLVLASADIILNEYAIENLCAPFMDDVSLGITCSRTIPLNKPDNFIGFAVNMQWRLHHYLSLKQPKFNELIAFRSQIHEISPTLVDEEYIASEFQQAGMKSRYIPKAYFYNKGPTNLRDFFVQRIRIYKGHAILKRKVNYTVSTFSSIRVFMCLFLHLKKDYFLKFHWMTGTIVIEGIARITALISIYLLNTPADYKWKIAESTKSLQKCFYDCL